MSTTLNAGFVSDSYKWYLYVQVVSSKGMVSTYNIPGYIVVNASGSANMISSMNDFLSNGSLQNTNVSQASATLTSFAQAINQAANTTNLSETVI